MNLLVNQRVQGTDGNVRKVMVLNGDQVTFQSGLIGEQNTVSRAAFEAWAAPPPPGEPTPADYDDAAPVITIGAPVPAEAPGVPLAVTPRQLRLALLGAGLLDTIDAFVASEAVPAAARISWEYAVEYRRDDVTLNAMAARLDPPLAAEQIDALFVAAAAI